MEQILKILENNARISVEDIAKMIGKPKKEVAGHIKECEQNGTIVAYKAIIDKSQVKTNGNVMAVIEVKITPQKNVGFDAVAAKIYKFPEVKSCYLLSGTYDLLLIVEGKDLNTVANFVAEKLSPLENVKGTATHFLLKKYKEDGIMFKKKNGKRLNISY